MGCTPSKPVPTTVSRTQISRPIDPNSRPIHSSAPASARQTLYQNSNYTHRTPAEKARMNAKPLPFLPPKAELRAKGQLDSHGKIIMVNQSRSKTLPRPSKPAQKTVARPAIPAKAPGHAARATQVHNYPRKPVPVPVKGSNPKPVQVPREIKRVPANHGQRVAFIDGKWVGPGMSTKPAYQGFQGYMVQRYDGKWVPARKAMKGKDGKEVVHSGVWF